MTREMQERLAKEYGIRINRDPNFKDTFSVRFDGACIKTFESFSEALIFAKTEDKLW